MTREVGTAIPVWGVAALGAVLIGVLIGDGDTFRWFPLLMALCVILTFVIQLAVVDKVGFVLRLMVSIGGAIGVLALATLVLGLVGIATG